MVCLRIFAPALVGVVIALAPIRSEAVTYDLSNDWSTSSNPNGVWTLREGNNPLTMHSNNSFFGGEDTWAASAVSGNFLPAFFKAETAAFDYVVGDVVVHTTDSFNGPGRGAANVVFTAASAGTIDLTGSIWNARWSNRLQSWEIRKNGLAGSLLASGALNNVARAAPTALFVLGLAIGAGETIVLSVFRNGDAGDFVGIDLSIEFNEASAVPLPAALPLMATGLGAMGWLGLRRRRKSA